MSRYSSYSYSSYRSPYLDSPSTTSSSSSYHATTYSLPTYEPKFESLISRTDGTMRSRAGTSTKYDYLSSYTSKYDLPYTSTSSYSKLLDADDLTRSYFEKYYNKSPSAAAAPTPETKYDFLTRPQSRTSRSYSVYLDEDNSSQLRSALTDARTKRSSSVLAENSLLRESASDVSARQSVLRDTTADTGYSSRQSMLRDTTADTSYSSRQSVLRDTGTVETGYASRLSSARRESMAEGASSSVYSSVRPSENGYSSSRYGSDSGYASRLSRTLSTNDTEDSGSITPSRYSRFLDRHTDTSSKNLNGSSGSETKEFGGYTRYSSHKDTEEPATSRRDSIRAYGGRSALSRLNSEEGSSSSLISATSRLKLQNGASGSEEEAEEGAGGGASGLRNIGNTCFMNSVIQCLSNTRPLADYVMTDEFSRDINPSSSMKGSLIKAFATVIKSLWKGNGRVVDPSSLKGALQRFAPRFSGYNQEDSQEFLRYLVEGLHEDVNRVHTKPPPINTDIDSSLSVSEQAMEAWKRYIRRDDSRLVDLFVGQLKSTLRCGTCDYESVTFEPFWDLSLPIPSRTGEVSLTDCFESFTKEEVLDGEEMPSCERCKCRRRCTKFYSLYKLPKILVVHLKRFSPTERFRSKLSTTVTFPLTGFDLTRFSDSPGRASYSCYAVSNHSGTLYSGHYTAYAKHSKSGQWYFYNDSRVSKCSCSSVISNEAYLLFFELS